MYPTTLATKEIKEDIEDLIQVVVEEEADPIPRIVELYDIVKEKEDYLAFIKDNYEHHIAVSDIVGQSLISSRFVDEVLSILAKYDKKQLMVILDSARMLLYNYPCK